MREFTEYEESMMRMWMRERGYSREYISRIIRTLNEISMKFGGIPSVDEARTAYWHKCYYTRRRMTNAVHVYERWFREEVQGKRKK